MFFSLEFYKTRVEEGLVIKEDAGLINSKIMFLLSWIVLAGTNQLFWSLDGSDSSITWEIINSNPVSQVK